MTCRRWPRRSRRAAPSLCAPRHPRRGGARPPGARGRAGLGSPRAASWTGSGCNDWAGHRTGPAYSAQGNILVGEETVGALATTFEGNAQLPLAQRLIECLVAAQAAGGDRRGQQSASLLVVQKNGGYAGLSDVLVDLRVDDHERPIQELQRIYGLHFRLFG